ncbi:MAG: hypothetical protein KJN90_11790 [Gammaproteobacteria bacterium]|nr:hypothetical protein [Gammaproteobacteria bacterium]
MSDENFQLKEAQISEEEWAQLISKVRTQDRPPASNHREKRDKQSAIPEYSAQYLNKLQLASISKLETFGWQLFFIRRSDPAETVTVMHLPSSGETAVIEKDGTVNRSHGVVIRTGE